MSALTAVAAPRRAPEADRRHLRVVGEQEHARRVSGPAVACVATAGLLVLLFVLAVMQTAIAQGQAHLDDLTAQTADRQAELQSLRLEVAQLESPERIVGEAQSRLGMVEPEVITYVQAADPSVPPAAPAAEAPVPEPTVPPSSEAP